MTGRRAKRSSLPPIAAILGSVLLAMAAPAPSFGQQTSYWGNQGDGTYRNPVLAGDFSDPDVIRVGDDFYLISSTINMAPGMAVLHSRDLVSWRIISHVIDDLSTLGPELNWDRMNRYGQGVYAGSIRYRDGTFFVHFTSFLEGIFVATARNPAGPWRVQPMQDGKGRPLRVQRWLDPCPFWDDDGRAYLVMSKPNGAWYPHLFRMSEDGIRLLDADGDAMARAGNQGGGEGALIYSRDSAEGSKIYKKDGFYYFFNNEVSWQGRMAVMRRSRFIYGERADGSAGTAHDPGAYQLMPLLKPATGTRELNQGGLVDTPSGDWYFLTHGGAGGFPDGRVVSLLPVSWVDGWPVAGEDEDRDGVGGMTWSAKLPVTGQPIHYPQGSDDFSARRLSSMWEWNHQPRADRWSLTARPGWLRLKAFRPLVEGSFFKAGNTLGQRYLSAAGVDVTVTIDLSGMKAGQSSGLAHFNGGKDFAAARVRREGSKFTLHSVVNDVAQEGSAIQFDRSRLWLRTRIDGEHHAAFSYSFDGKEFLPMPGRFALKWGGYRGTYIGLFTYNDSADEGHMDVDNFEYRFSARPER